MWSGPINVKERKEVVLYTLLRPLPNVRDSTLGALASRYDLDHLWAKHPRALTQLFSYTIPPTQNFSHTLTLFSHHLVHSTIWYSEYGIWKDLGSWTPNKMLNITRSKRWKLKRLIADVNAIKNVFIYLFFSQHRDPGLKKDTRKLVCSHENCKFFTQNKKDMVRHVRKHTGNWIEQIGAVLYIHVIKATAPTRVLLVFRWDLKFFFYWKCNVVFH